MLSLALIGAPQTGQADGGETIDSFLGTRYTMTFTNDPTASPRTAHEPMRIPSMPTKS